VLLLAAVLDTNVLFPASLRDTLLRAGAAGLYRMYWTETILVELRRNLTAKNSWSPEKVQRLIDAMNQHFGEMALIHDYEHLIGVMTNDPKDRHVLAAAVHIGAQVIVTSNLADFPDDALEPYGIEAQSPDEFLLHLCELHKHRLAQIIVEQAHDLTNPPHTPEQVLDTLAQHVPMFVAEMRTEWEAYL